MTPICITSLIGHSSARGCAGTLSHAIASTVLAHVSLLYMFQAMFFHCDVYSLTLPSPSSAERVSHAHTTVRWHTRATDHARHRTRHAPACTGRHIHLPLRRAHAVPHEAPHAPQSSAQAAPDADARTPLAISPAGSWMYSRYTGDGCGHTSYSVQGFTSRETHGSRWSGPVNGSTHALLAKPPLTRHPTASNGSQSRKSGDAVSCASSVPMTLLRRPIFDAGPHAPSSCAFRLSVFAGSDCCTGAPFFVCGALWLSGYGSRGGSSWGWRGRGRG